MRLPDRRPLMEELEPRVLYSADLAPGLGPVPAAPLAEYRPVEEGRTDEAGWAQQATQGSVELVVVDSRVEDAETLIAALSGDGSRRLEVVRLDARIDGIDQLNWALASYHDVSAIHVLSHGEAGRLLLGAGWIDGETLANRAGDISGWAASLTTGADILIYGCDMAADEAGQTFVATLAGYTGADVAASMDRTGSAALGGNWVLEVHQGRIETEAMMLTAWTGTLGDEFLVNTYTPNDQNTNAADRGSQNAVAYDGAGNYVVVWTSKSQDGDGDGVYARIFRADGSSSGEFRVNQTTSLDQFYARVASDQAGNFVVTWTSDGQDGDNWGVYCRRFNMAGTALSNEMRVNTTTSTAQWNSVVAMNSATGDFVIAWEGRGSGDSYGTWFRRYAADGTALDATERRANQSDYGTEINPAVAMDTTGRFVVTYEVDNHLYFQRFNADGTAAGGRSQVDNGFSNTVGAAIAMDAAGNFTVVYRETTTLAGVWARGYYADGSQRFGWVAIDISSADSPSIAMANDGSFVVSYHKSGSSGLDVIAKKYTASGGAIGSAFTVNQTSNGDQHLPSVALRDMYNYVVVWCGNGTGDSNGVYARVYGNTAPAITSGGGGATASASRAENGTAVTTVTATDADLPAQTLTYSIVGGLDAARFSIDSASGALAFVSPPNYEAPSDSDGNNVYVVTVQVDDGHGGTDTQTINVTVTNLNEAPTANADAYALPQDSTLLVPAGSGVLANDSDPESNALTATLVGGPTHGAVTLNADGSFSYTPTAGFTGTDSFSYRTSDGTLTSTSATVTLTVTPVNYPPTTSPVTLTAMAEDGGSRLITQAELLANANDANGDPLVATGLVITGGTGSLVNNGDGTWSYTPAANDNSSVAFGYTITDGSLAVGGTASLDITPVNDPPTVANAIPDRTATEDAVFNFPFAASTFADIDAGDTRTYSASGVPPWLTFTPGTRTFSGTPGNADVGSYTITVRATDAGGLWVEDQFVLTVTNVNDAPVITSDGGGATASISVAENSVAATTVTASDVDGPALTYSISGGADAARFQIDAATGVLSFVTAPDREAPVDADANNVYQVIVHVSDGSLTDTQAISVTVTPVNDNAPTITSNGGGATAALSVQENGTAVTLVTATDSDQPPQTLTYSIAGGADAARFAIDGASGALTFLVAPDFEAPTDTGADNIYDVLVQVSDGGFVDMQAISVTVTDRSESAISGVSNVDPTPDQVAENAAIGTTVGVTALAVDPDVLDTVAYSLDDDAGGRFQIDAGTGVVSVANGSLLDYEAATSHTITVRATSTDGSFSTASFSIAVLPVEDDPPVITSNGGGAAASVSAAENGTAATTVTATDADLPAQTLTYSIAGGADAARFQIDINTGVLSFLVAPDYEAPADANADNVYEVTVQASDGAGGTDAQAISVGVTNVNEAPGFTSTAVTAGTQGVAYTYNITAADPDAGASLVISAPTLPAWLTLTDNGNGTATLSGTPANGDVGSHAVQLQVGDGSLAATQNFTITVANVNDSPTVANAISDQSATQGVGFGYTVPANAFADADAGDSLGYSASGVPPWLTFNAGTRTFTGTPANADVGNYTITVRATDVSGAWVEDQFVLTVTNVNDAPVITSDGGGSTANESIAENTTVVTTVTASDIDVPAQTLSYSIAGGADAARFQIDAATGVLSFVAAPDREAPADADANNVYQVTVQVSDGSLTDTQAISVSIANVNEAPVGVADGGNGVEDGTIAGNVLINDSDPENDSLTATLVSGPAFGALTLNADGSYVYTPNPDWNGTDSFSYRASDGVLSSNTATVTLNVAAGNDAPAITSDGGGATAAISLPENSTGVTTVTASDIDVPAQTLTYGIVGGADAALFLIDANTGALSFAAAPDYELPTDANGDNIYEVTVQVSDGAANAAQQISLTITNVTEAPPPSQPAAPEIPGMASQSSPPADSSQDPPANGRTNGQPSNKSASQSAPAQAAPEGLPAAGGSAASFIADTAPSTQLVLSGWEAGGRALGGTWFVTAVLQPANNNVAMQAMLPPQMQEIGFTLSEAAQLQALDLLKNAMNSAGYGRALDEMRDAIAQPNGFENVVVGTSAAVSGSLSVGYVLWLLRGGALVGSLLSALPAWTVFDPLPVLAYKAGDDDGEDDATERMFDNRKKRVRRARKGKSLTGAPPGSEAGR